MDELTYGLEESLDVLDSTSLGVEQFANTSGTPTSAIVTSVIFCIWSIICRWKMFEKAGLPGWGAIIPFYNIYLRFKMAGMSGWWVLGCLFPPVVAIALIVSFFKIPEKFGKHRAWGFGLWFLNPIFIGIFAFDKSTYTA